MAFRHVIRCQVCHQQFNCDALRHAKFCSDACRQFAYRRRKAIAKQIQDGFKKK